MRSRAESLILIVDDDAGSRRIYTRALEAAGLCVMEAGTAGEAVQLALAVHPGVILMDLMTPGVTGLEAARQLKADPRTAAIPIIAFTAAAAASLSRRALESGFSAFVGKPCAPAELLLEVRRALDAGGCSAGDAARPAGSESRPQD